MSVKVMRLEDDQGHLTFFFQSETCFKETGWATK